MKKIIALLLKPIDSITGVIYWSRYILIPIYLSLFASLIVYAYKVIEESYGLFYDTFISGTHITEEDLLFKVLSILDIAMIANLIIMILIGSYSIFVKKITAHDKPQWLRHITAGSLKTKMSASVVGVSTIHLLKNFVNSASMTDHDLIVKSAIHLFFIVSTIAMAKTDYITHAMPIEDHEKDEHNTETKSH